jgi:hypothetical protein
MFKSVDSCLSYWEPDAPEHIISGLVWGVEDLHLLAEMDHSLLILSGPDTSQCCQVGPKGWIL